MKYKFDWKDIIHGQLEIDAENGVEAEKLFKEMSLKKRLALSTTSSDEGTLNIKYVDNGIGDIHTLEEWSKKWKHIS